MSELRHKSMAKIFNGYRIYHGLKSLIIQTAEEKTNFLKILCPHHVHILDYIYSLHVQDSSAEIHSVDEVLQGSLTLFAEIFFLFSCIMVQDHDNDNYQGFEL